MGCTNFRGSNTVNAEGAEEIQTAMKLVLNTITTTINNNMQIQNKHLENSIVYHAKIIRQSLNEQTKYLKCISQTMQKCMASFCGVVDGKGPNKDRFINCEESQQQIEEQIILQANESKIYDFQQSEKSKMIQDIPSEKETKNNGPKQGKLNNKDENSNIQNYSQRKMMNYNQNKMKNRKRKIVMRPKSHNGFVFLKEPSINYKEKFIRLPLLIPFNQMNAPQLDKWLIKLYETINQQSFFGFSNQLMTESETKGFYSKNLLHNFINLLKFIKQSNEDYELTNLFKIFQKKSKRILKYQKLKYPEASKIIISQTINNLIQSCSKHEDPQNNLIKNAGINFTLNYKRNYNKEIKRFINILMKAVCQEFKNFEKDLKNIFKKKMNTETQIIIENDKNDKKKELGNEYLHHKIGTKININVPLFEEKSDSISIPNSQILRVIIKWIEHLKQKFRKPEEHILDRIHPFTGKNQRQINLDIEAKKEICEKWKQFIQKVNQKRQKKFLIGLQNSILDYIEKNKHSLSFINQQEVQIGLAAHILSQEVTKLAVNELNELIHTILQFQELYKPEDKKTQHKNKQEKTQSKKSFYDVNYVTFNVFDLMRAQCTGNIEEIREVYLKLKENKDFNIIRVKNRLQTGNRDFLINFRYKNLLICQLQLGMKLGEEQKKLTYTAKFNHFLYELQRTIYGTLRESSYVIIQQLQHYNKIKDFLKIQIKQEIKVKRQSQNISNDNLEIHSPLRKQPEFRLKDLQEVNSIFICKECYQISSEARFKKDDNQYCCNCVIEKLDNKTKCSMILGPSFQGTQVQQITQNGHYILVNKNNINCKNWTIGQNSFYVDIEQNMDNIITKNWQAISVRELKEDHKFLILRNDSTIVQYIIASLLFKLNIKNEENVDYKIAKFGYSSLRWLVEKAKKKKKVKRWVENQIHQINFQNWKFDEKQFKGYLEKFESITNLNLSANNLRDIEFLHTIHLQKQNLQKLQKLNISNNQNIVIKVLNFKSLRRLQITKAGLKEFKLELMELQYLDISQNELSELNIEKFRKLKHLNISKNYKLVKLDMKDNRFLQYINAINEESYTKRRYLKVNIGKYDSSIEKINYSGILLDGIFIRQLEGKYLKELVLQSVKIVQNDFVIENHMLLKKIQLINYCESEKKIIIGDISGIQIININDEGYYGEKNMKSLQIDQEAMMNLKQLRIESAKIEEVRKWLCLQSICFSAITIPSGSLLIPQLGNLKQLKLQYMELNELKIQKSPYLQYIFIEGSQADSLTIPELSNLKRLKIWTMIVGELNIEKCPCLEQIDLSGINTQAFTIPQLHNLKKLILNYIIVDELRIQKWPSLQQINLWKIEIGNRILIIPEVSNLKKLQLKQMTVNHLKIEKWKLLQQINLTKINILSGGAALKIPEFSNLKILKLQKMTVGELRIQKYPCLQQINLIEITITNGALTILELRYLKNLKLEDMLIDQLRISRSPYLQQIDLHKIKINNGFIMSYLSNLKKLKLNNMTVTELKIEKWPCLEQIYLGTIQIVNGAVSISQLSNLKKIYLEYLTVVELGIQNYPCLEQMKLRGVQISDESLIIPEFSYLKKLKLEYMTVEQLKIQKSSCLEQIQLYKIRVNNELIISNLSYLSSIELNSIEVCRKLVISNLPRLKTFRMASTLFAKIKIQFCPMIETLICRDNNHGRCDLDKIKKEKLMMGNKYVEEYKPDRISTAIIHE